MGEQLPALLLWLIVYGSKNLVANGEHGELLSWNGSRYIVEHESTLTDSSDYKTEIDYKQALQKLQDYFEVKAAEKGLAVPVTDAGWREFLIKYWEL